MTPEYWLDWLDWLGCLWVGKSVRGLYLRFDGHTSDGFCLYDPAPMTIDVGPEWFHGYTEPQPDWSPCTKARAGDMIAMFWREAMAR